MARVEDTVTVGGLESPDDAQAYTWIAHLDMDAFFASVEQLTRPTLRGRPVIVAGVDGRGVVAGASYEARRYGAHSAMPTHQALKLMGYAGIAVKPRFRVYSVASQRVIEVLSQYADVLEQVSVDEAYVSSDGLTDVTATQAYEWAQNVRDHIYEETGLNCSVGVALTKLDAKIASDLNKPHGICVVSPERREEILYPLRVETMGGIGPVTHNKLRAAGVLTMGDLARMDDAHLELVLPGKVGSQLRTYAQGHDPRIVHPPEPRKQVSAERTFPEDLHSPELVREQIDRVTADAFRRLARDGRNAKTVTVKFKLPDFRSYTRSYTLPWATKDKDLLITIIRQLEPNPLQVGAIRLLGVGFSGLSSEEGEALISDNELVELMDTPSTFTHLESAGVQPVSSPDRDDEGEDKPQWHNTEDVYHPEYGHGWIQGAGHGKITVRFETRSSGPGRMKNLDYDDPMLEHADPQDSLDWEQWFEKRKTVQRDEDSA